MYDIIIIGGGPGGYVAAIRGAQLGAKVALIEKEQMGGVCLNRGCIPTKALLHSANLFTSIKNASQFGIQTAAPAIDFGRMIARKDQVVKTLVGGVQWLMKNNGIEVFKGEADVVSDHQITVNGNVLEGRHIIIAVGSSPVIPPFPGAAAPRVITSDEALSLSKLPESLAIIGGGVIGIEMAALFQSLGCAATVIEMADRLAPMMDRDISKALLELLQKMGVKVYTAAKVAAINGGAVAFHYQDSLHNLPAAAILMAVGRRSNGLTLSLDKIGLQHERGTIATDNRLRTNIPNIYAIGDVNGKFMLAHVASAEGIVAVENIMGHDRVMDYGAVPQCIYTAPEVAAVGLTEEQAIQEGYRVKVSQIPLMANGKSLAEGHTKGFVKMIADDATQRILGVHMMTPHATDMIAQGAMAMTLGASAGAAVATVFPHPTVSEMMHEALHGIVAKPIHM